MGFPGSSAGKESACNAGDPGSIPGSRRATGEGIGYPLQYSWASLRVQLVKNLPTMQETWVRSLGWEDPLEKGKATHSSILAWRTPWLYRVGHDWVTFSFHFQDEWKGGNWSIGSISGYIPRRFGDMSHHRWGRQHVCLLLAYSPST